MIVLGADDITEAFNDNKQHSTSEGHCRVPCDDAVNLGDDVASSFARPRRLLTLNMAAAAATAPLLTSHRGGDAPCDRATLNADGKMCVKALDTVVNNWRSANAPP